MSDMLPEVDTCLRMASIRVGMMLIGVLSITTGAMTLGVVEQQQNLDYEKVRHVLTNVSTITEIKQIIPNINSIIGSSVIFVGFLFIFAGIACLISTLTDQEECAQVFVWLILLNIFIGSILVLAVTLQCSFLDTCVLGNMDWLSEALVVILLVAYLILWYYFCCVANSYLLKEYT